MKPCYVCEKYVGPIEGAEFEGDMGPSELHQKPLNVQIFFSDEGGEKIGICPTCFEKALFRCVERIRLTSNTQPTGTFTYKGSL